MTEKVYNKITVSSEKRKPRRLKDNPTDYRLVKMANIIFLFCIIFEVVGIMTILFFGTVGAQMSIYFMTFLFSLFLYKKHKDEVSVSINVRDISLKTLLFLSAMTVCGIPIAMILNTFGSILSGTGAEVPNDVNAFPFIPALIIYALIPGIVEEFVFRGIILGIYCRVDVRAGILISSIFFALLHFSPGSILYGFLFGIIFALVRIGTGNIIYSMIMHCLFNGLNVMLSYINMELLPTWAVLGAIVSMTVIFFIMLVRLLKEIMQNGVDLTSMTIESKYAMSRLITKEGYVTIAVCLTIMVLLMVV